MTRLLQTLRVRWARRRIREERYSSMRIEQAAIDIGQWLYRSKYCAKFGSERAYCQKMAEIYRKRLEWYIKNY